MLLHFLATARERGIIIVGDVIIGFDSERSYDETSGENSMAWRLPFHIPNDPSGNLIRTQFSVGGTSTMFARTLNNQDLTDGRTVAIPFTEDVAELSLLLPAWQVSALEQAAHTRGVTTAAMLRRMIEEFFGRTQRIMETSARQWA